MALRARLLGQSQPEKLARSASREIDKLLDAEKKEQKGTRKVLILGPSMAGKSTLLAQIRYRHSPLPLSSAEFAAFVPSILGNVLDGLQRLIALAERMGIPFECEGPEFETVLDDIAGLTPEALFARWSAQDFAFAQGFLQVWKDKGSLAIRSRRSFHLDHSIQYFIDHMDRIAAPEYVPTQKDILHVRIPTAGLKELPLKIGSKPFIFYDSSGQRSSRAKWTYLFEVVHVIMFVVSVACFDLMLEEDPTINQMHDSLVLFESIVNHELLQKADLILFLNKVDLFRLKTQRLKVEFPDFDCNEPDLFKPGLKFLGNKFNSRVHHRARPYIHFLQATDISSTQAVLKTVETTVLANKSQGHRFF